MTTANNLTGLSIIVGICAALLGCSRSDISLTPSARCIAEGNKPRDVVRVAGIVLKWIPADKERNYRRIEPLIRESAARRADIVITTECFLDGYAIRDKSIPIDAWRKMGEEIPGGTYVNKLCALADELDIYLVAGMLERAESKTYNTAVLIGPDGQLIGKYHKQHLGHEQPRNTPGHTNPVFSTRLGKIGIMICADRRYPSVAKGLKENGADFIIVPSGGMWGPVDNDHHLQARSRENAVPIVFVHPIEFLVTGPDGSILEQRFVGKNMDITVEQIGTPADEQQVFIYNLHLDGQ